MQWDTCYHLDTMAAERELPINHITRLHYEEYWNIHRKVKTPKWHSNTNKYKNCVVMLNFSILAPTGRCLLTHWGRVTHICVSKLTIIGSDNGLSLGRRQAIIWTNDGILLIWPLGTNFSEILIETGLPLGFFAGVAETLPGVAQGAPKARGEPRRGEATGGGSGPPPPRKILKKWCNLVQYGAFWVVFDEPMRCTKYALKMTE